MGAQRGAPGGALFPHLTAPSPSPPHRLTSTASATSTTSAPPNLGTNDPPTPYPSATRELEAPPDVPSPPVTSGSPPVGTPPGAGGSRELALGARGPGAAAGASSGAISRFLAGPGAEQMEAPPRSLQARLRATAGSPACCSHPKIPPPQGHQGGSRRLHPGAWFWGSGPSPGHQPCQRSPFPCWAPLLVQAARPETGPKKPFLGHFGAAFGIPTRDGSTPGTLRPNTRCAPTHAVLCAGNLWPLQQCRPHHSWEPGPKTTPGGGRSTPSPVRCPSLHSGAAAPI